MKKIKNSLLIIVFILLIGVTFNVKAEDFSYYLSTNEDNYEYVDKNNVKARSAKRGDTITVSAMLNNKDNVSDYRLNSGKLTIRWDDKYLALEEVDGKYYNANFTDIMELTLGGISKSSNKLSFNEISSMGNLRSGKNRIADFKFRVLDDAPSGEAKIYQMDGEDSLKCFYVIEERTVACGESLYSEIKLNIGKSKVNTLASLKINGKELEYFNEATTTYDLTVESNIEKVNIAVVKKDEKSSISGNIGDNPLKYGDNKFTIIVVSEAGESNTYTINVKREDTRSEVNTLKTLKLSAGDLKFNSNETEYNITVENNIDTITVTSTLTDPKSKYVEDYSRREVELNEGSNKIEIKVVSEKGNERVYTININRLLSSNTSLKVLKVNDEKIELKANEFIYNLIVENNVSDVVIKAEPTDAKATVQLEERYPLQVGDNEINITVVAASGTKALYTVNINRKKLLSKDSMLSSLKIEGYDIGFKPTSTLYNLKIKDEDDELKITATPSDPNATVNITGNKDLVNGSIVKIEVKAEDDSYTRYFINIEKGSAGISPIIIIILVLLILLAACVGIIFYRKKRKEKKEFEKFDDKAGKGKKKEEEIEEEPSKEEPQEEEERKPIENETPLEPEPVVEEKEPEEEPAPIPESSDEPKIEINDPPIEIKEKSVLNYDEEYAKHVKKVLPTSEEEQNKDVE